MAQENDAEYRHTVFGGSKSGVGSQIVGGLPEIGFRVSESSGSSDVGNKGDLSKFQYNRKGEVQEMSVANDGEEAMRSRFR